MEKTARVTEVVLVNGTQGDKEVLYYHRIKLDNGDEGKMEQCTEPDPQWLKKGIPLTYTIREGRYGFLIKKYVKRADAVQHISSSMPAHSEYRGKRNKDNQSRQRSGWSSSRLDDNPDYWMLRQKCISMTTCLDRANELVIAKVIDLKERHETALEDFNFIFKHAGFDSVHKNNLVTPESESEITYSDTEKNGNKESIPSKGKDKNSPAPTVQTLFKDDSELEQNVLKDIYILIDKCDTPAKLAKLEKNLNPKWLEREGVIGAINIKRMVLKQSKK